MLSRASALGVWLMLSLAAPVLADPTAAPATQQPPSPPQAATTAATPNAPAAPAAAPVAPVYPAPGSVIAELRGLDKTTARVSSFEAPAGEPVRFGTLDITVRDCRKRPPEAEPEVAAYMEISEIRPPEKQNDPPEVRQYFKGWMFASSPAVSALEHPVYDIWVIDCKTPSGSPGKSG